MAEVSHQLHYSAATCQTAADQEEIAFPAWSTHTPGLRVALQKLVHIVAFPSDIVFNKAKHVSWN